MGLFDEVAGGVMKEFGSGGTGNNPLVDGIMQLITNQQHGGLAGIVKQFSDKGLGDIVSSWVGTGQNLPVSPEQIQKGLGSGAVQDIATKLGISTDDASAGLAQMLPNVIDKLTPDGKVPTGDLLTQGLDLLKGKLF